MIARRILVENFMSFGGPVAFDFGDEPLWLLSGPNGSGKSAVFDAVTYSLFGQHRGGRQNMDQLTRHGADGFRVEFDFAFAGADYRVVRTHRSAGRGVERLFERHGDDWQEVPLDGGRNKVGTWVEARLGLTYDQFTASVLLLQGEADRIITATGADRLEMLKKILGLARYEELHDRLKATAAAAKRVHEEADARLAAAPAVGDAEVADAEAERQRLADEAATADADAEVADARLADATRFAQLQAEWDALDRQLRDAEGRAAQSERLLSSHERHQELARVVGPLGVVVGSRAELARLAGAIARAAESRQASEAECETAGAKAERANIEWRAIEDEATALDAAAEPLDRQLRADREVRPTVAEIEECDRWLADHPDDAGRLGPAERAVENCRDAADHARAARAECRTLLKQLEAEFAEFERGAGDGRCPRCGQSFTDEHRRREHARYAADLDRLRAEVAAADAAHTQATAALREDETEYKSLRASAQARQDHITRRELLGRHREPVTTAELDCRIAASRDRLAMLKVRRGELEPQLATAKARADDLARRHRQSLADHAEAERRHHADTQAHNLLLARVDATAEQLPAEWRSRAGGLTADGFAEIEGEFRTLEALDLATQVEQLRLDRARHADRIADRDALADRLAGFAPETRFGVDAAAAALAGARGRAREVAEARAAHERSVADLARRREAHAEMAQAERDAERAHRLRHRLAELLGPRGLLRDLVRDAERQIVGFANDTLRAFTDQSLSLELDDSGDGLDRAFDLKVRRDGSEPIGAKFLSGSQRFRIAVAVALGIGRFATAATQARPLETVIIDEGFGSLDRDGLRAMADELLRLRDHSGLKRILLVSHQDEFARSFPVGWELTPTAAGTQAKPFRRPGSF